MSARPWMKWFPSDWRGDPMVRACDPITRYVWMEMLGLMHEAEPYGHLVLGGRSMDTKTLSRIIAVELSDVRQAVRLLEEMGVFSRTDGGTIYSRRMVRDEKKRKKLAEIGKSGGNPALRKQEVSTTKDNHKDKGEDNGRLKTQKPEARSHKPDRKTNPLPDAYHQIAEAGGMLGIPPDHALAKEWLALPDMELERDILPVVRRVAERVRATGGRTPFKFKLFDAAIREQQAEDAAEIERLRRSRARIERQDEARRAEQRRVG